MDNQVNIITAQGRREKRSAGGTVIHNCTVAPHPDLEKFTDKVKTYQDTLYPHAQRQF
jgi:pectinesterase